MSYRLVSSKKERLTPQHVKEAANAPHIPGERPIKPRRARFIRGLLQNGKFCRADFAYAKCKEDGVVYRVNGQHTSHELAMCDDAHPELPDFPKDVDVDIEFWECDFLSELADIFDTFDNPTSARSNDDKLGVFMAQYDDLTGISKILVRSSLQAVNEYRREVPNDDVRPVHARELGVLLADPEIRDFVQFAADFEDSVWKGWRNCGIGAAIYESWKDDPAVARDIWAEVFEESNPDPRSSTRIWASTMRATEARSGKDKRWYYRSARREYRKWKKAVNASVA